MGKKIDTGAPFACHLGSFGPEARRAHQERTQRLLAAAKLVEELPDGWRVTLPDGNGLFREAAEWVRVERECCPFFAFDFTVEGPREPFTLAIRGPEGSKQILQAELSQFGGWPAA